MSRLWRLIAAASAIAASFVSGAWAQDAAPIAPLLPGDVATAASDHYPSVLQSLAARRGASGDLLKKQGSFDTVFSARARSRAVGFWDGQVAEAKVKKPIGPFGAEVFGSYRLSEGSFPVYEDIEFTDELGEIKLGILFSLLRDRLIDDRRFGIRDAEIALEQAELEVLLTRIGVQQQALLAYWRWVAAGRQLGVYEDLLRLAEARDEGLQREVAQGARAAIFLTENAQNLTRRRILVAEAKRDFQQAANALSLYYRDRLGQPVIPPRTALPPANLLPPPPPSAGPMPASLANQPALRLLDLAADRARGRISLARNELRPRLDMAVEVGEDLGRTAEGGSSRDDAEVIIGLEFEVPFGRRAAKGRLAAAEAELEALQLKQRLSEERLRAELADIVVNLQTAARLLSLARQEVSQADTMRRAEQRRFRGGASDFFLVNLREEALADARVRLAESELALRAARATYDAAVLDFSALGLTN